MKIDLGVIFFAFPPIPGRESPESHAASHVKWSGLLSNGFEVIGRLVASGASRQEQQHSSATSDRDVDIVNLARFFIVLMRREGLNAFSVGNLLIYCLRRIWCKESPQCIVSAVFCCRTQWLPLSGFNQDESITEHVPMRKCKSDTHCSHNMKLILAQHTTKHTNTNHKYWSNLRGSVLLLCTSLTLFLTLSFFLDSSSFIHVCSRDDCVSLFIRL